MRLLPLTTAAVVEANKQTIIYLTRNLPNSHNEGREEVLGSHFKIHNCWRIVRDFIAH